MYRPSLSPDALRAAADVLRESADHSRSRANDIALAGDVIVGSGFAGAAAALALSGFPVWSLRITSAATMLNHAAHILEHSANVQQALDRIAYVALHLDQAEVVHQLNTLAWLLDTRTARALRALSTALEHQQDSPRDRLADHPGESLAQRDARLRPTLPAALSEQISAAGGLVLETGPGGTTTVIGDVIDPARVTTMVAGVSTGRPDQLAGELAKARGIAATTGGAVIVWQGYTPPPSVVHGIDPAAAHTGGAELALFQAAVRERYPQAQLTVLAHSYGTVVAARAAQGPGLAVDDLWLLGSPGVGAESVDKLALLGAHPQVYVADADRDPITATRFGHEAAHGYSPSAESFGATRIDGVRGDHSAYFTDPVLLAALARAGRQAESVPSAL